MDELKPCPFCEKDNIRISRDDDIPPWFFVYCVSCGGRSDVFPKEEEAVKAWNKRPSATSNL